MAQAKILINSLTGSVDDVEINQQVQLSNDDAGSTTSWNWEILDQPPGTVNSLSNAAIKSPTITPTKEGTYLFKITVQPGTLTDTAYFTVRHLKSRARIPSTGEVSGSSGITGSWAKGAVDDILKNVDDLMADPGFIVGVLGEANCSVGDVMHISGKKLLKSGLDGEETIPVFTKASASVATNLSGTLALVHAAVNETGSLSSGSLARFRYFGLASSFPGSPSLYDPVYVADNCVLSLTAGTVEKVVGRVAWKSGSTYSVWFNGVGESTATPYTHPEDISLGTLNVTGTSGISTIISGTTTLAYKDSSNAFLIGDDVLLLKGKQVSNSTKTDVHVIPTNARTNGDIFKISSGLATPSILNVSSSLQVGIISGSTSKPGLVIGDNGTGLSKPASGQFSISLEGAERMRFNSSISSISLLIAQQIQGGLVSGRDDSSQFSIRGGSVAQTRGFVIMGGGSNYSATSGEQVGTLFHYRSTNNSFAPSTGNARFTAISCSFEINQTSTATGSYIGFDLGVEETSYLGGLENARLMALRTNGVQKFTVFRDGRTSMGIQDGKPRASDVNASGSIQFYYQSDSEDLWVLINTPDNKLKSGSLGKVSGTVGL